MMLYIVVRISGLGLEISRVDIPSLLRLNIFRVGIDRSQLAVAVAVARISELEASRRWTFISG